MATQGKCDECGECALVRYIDNARRCGYFCLVCVPPRRIPKGNHGAQS